MTTSALNDILTTINASLKVAMQTGVASTDPTRANLVRPGLLQQSPLIANINVLTRYNDPDEPNAWRHSVVGIGESIHVHLPNYEVGGGGFFYRRFTTKLEQFFRSGVNREQAEELSAIIMSRAEETIAETRFISGSDSFGETPMQAYIHSSTNIEAGGQGQFIYKGKIWWVCLTEKNLTLNP
jgi:hypothetical protein